MSWSLQLRNGDLTLSTGGLGKVTGITKLTQDLRDMFLTQRGSSPLHPEYGSALDGGYDEFGNYTRGVIGVEDMTMVEFLFDQEVRQVVAALQNQQLGRAKTDSVIYGKATLTPDEVLVSYSIESLVTVGDTLEATIHLQTAANTTSLLQLSIPTV